jgi:hypothetical protein
MGSKRKTVTIQLQDGETVKVTEQQNGFVRSLAMGNKMNDAYINNYNHTGTRKVATVRGYELLQKANVQQAFEYYQEINSRKLDISENRILAEYAAMGFSNIADVITCTDPSEITKLAPQTQRAIKKIKKTLSYDKDGNLVGESLDIEMHGKRDALDRVAEMKGYIGKDKDKKQEKAKDITVIINNGGATVQ